MSQLAGDLSAEMIMGVNLEDDSPQLASVEATALLQGIGADHIEAFEVGNEPSLYATLPWYETPAGQPVPGAPPGYDYSDYAAQFKNVVAALGSTPLAGPALGSPRWMRKLPAILDDNPELQIVTYHRYPLDRCYTSASSDQYPTIANLLSTTSITGSPARSRSSRRSRAPTVASSASMSSTRSPAPDRPASATRSRRPCGCSTRCSRSRATAPRRQHPHLPVGRLPAVQLHRHGRRSVVGHGRPGVLRAADVHPGGTARRPAPPRRIARRLRARRLGDEDAVAHDRRRPDQQERHDAGGRDRPRAGRHRAGNGRAADGAEPDRHQRGDDRRNVVRRTRRRPASSRPRPRRRRWRRPGRPRTRSRFRRRAPRS